MESGAHGWTPSNEGTTEMPRPPVMNSGEPVLSKKMARLRRTARKSVPGGPYHVEGFQLPEQFDSSMETKREAVECETKQPGCGDQVVTSMHVFMAPDRLRVTLHPKPTFVYYTMAANSPAFGSQQTKELAEQPF
ncbi:hypothetical protein AgCh_006378 [Apium graveolens]